MPALLSHDLNIERRMTNHHTQPLGRCATPVLVALCLAVLANACSRDNDVQRTSSGTIDTSVLREGAFTPAAGPGIHVTRTDEKSVQLATKYKLTDDNFNRFMRAADSLSRTGETMLSRSCVPNSAERPDQMMSCNRISAATGSPTV